MELLAPIILVDYEQAKSEISAIINGHSSLNYLTPIQYKNAFLCSASYQGGKD
ncbi:hypothetical protein ACNF42_02210 [Cuniculiplasma sp. SKW3]|uniref:hypothetical protein n=1 Tax=Cuniculiplasma sp. SKW3 TaxID=3400170 RepID=UPI003FD1FBAE